MTDAKAAPEKSAWYYSQTWGRFGFIPLLASRIANAIRAARAHKQA